MKLRTTLASIAILALTTVALADSAGSAGTIVRIGKRSSANSLYAYWHAVFYFDEDADGTVDRTYYTGGAYCDGITELTTADREVLERAAQQALSVAPEYQLGSTTFGSPRCITGFSVSF